MAFPHIRTLALTAGLATLASTAQAHTGHGTHTLMQGLSHPLGLDHLLAMVAVGVWSASSLPARQAWQGPASFMLALMLSALLGTQGWSVPYLEPALALSVLLFGLMLMPLGRQLPKALGLGVIAAAASLHGLAHGAEAPSASLGGYLLGFLLTTGVLHAAGMALSLNLQRRLHDRAHLAIGTLGGLFAGAGVFLFGQLAL